MLQLLRRLFGDTAITDAAIADRYPNFRYNYTLGIVNGVFFNTGLSFFNRTTIIPLFMASLGAPSIMIALLSLAESLGWLLPQFFASRLIVHKSLKMPLYRNAALL